MCHFEKKKIIDLYKDERIISHLPSKRYSLRDKVTPVPVKIQKKPLNQIIATSQAALFTSRAIRIWDNAKKLQAKKFELKIDDIVCARMAGHRP